MSQWIDIGAQFKSFSTLPIWVALKSQQNPPSQNGFQTQKNWILWIWTWSWKRRGGSQMNVKERDIRGAIWAKCGEGKTRVVHYTLPSGKERFFFGCDKSTEAQKCPGSTNWQPIQVPIDVIEEMGLGHLLQINTKKKGKKAAEKERSEGSRGRSCLWGRRPDSDCEDGEGESCEQKKETLCLWRQRWWRVHWGKEQPTLLYKKKFTLHQL